MTAPYPSTSHFESVVTDRTVEEPWAVAHVRPGERVLDVGSATSRYLAALPHGCRVYAIDLRPVRPVPGVGLVRGDVMAAPFAPGSFDAITCVSTVEHFGLDVYGQGPDEFGDEVAMRHIRRLLRPGGRVVLTAPFGKRSVNAWLRVYDRASFRRILRGYSPLEVAYYRLEGGSYVPCAEEDARLADFDTVNMRSGAVVLAELTPSTGFGFPLARLSLRLRRTWARLVRRGPFWRDPLTGEPAAAWLRRHDDARERPGRG